MKRPARSDRPADAQAHKSRLLDTQRAYNESTRALWDVMGAHRGRVTREILKSAKGGRLSVLGAGNCNDFDLTQLLSVFTEVHLVDLDAEALDAGARRQGLASSERLHLHGGIDFSGLPLALMRDAPGVDAFSLELHEGIRQSLFAGPPPSDVVVSACVLSQLIEGVATAPSRHGNAKERAVAVRERHLDLLMDSTVRGGSLLLVSDLVSSDTAPELRICSDLSLPRLRDELIARHNYFHGTNPYAIEESLRHRHKGALSRLERRPPWRWSLGDKVFLVTALRMERA